jgi:energy-coupling factor transporter ATP-binding protein EcfA2
VKIETLTVTNFRGIKAASLSGLQTMVVIAGQNGSGKSCLLDAIRLLKSVYGGYQQNEWHHWMGEFQINFTNRDDLATLLNDPTRELRITCEFSIHSDERQYIRTNSEDLVRQSIWRTMYPELYAWSTFRAVSLAAHLRTKEAEIKDQVKSQVEALLSELSKDRIFGEFIISPGQPATVRPSKTLEIIFGTFRPHYLGVIDYHGPHRMYTRETLGGINLNLDAIEQQRSAAALYNYVNKYANVKSEMAATYIKEILAGAAGNRSDAQTSLSNTLKELFKTFFPDKEFLGPIPTRDGNLMFPVKTGDGSTHDLNELSAGEKEVLYGYLRLRNSAPKFSVILLDEPELHLNPRLIKGLPAFYHKYLGSALDNQIWLITHSDALLREAVGPEGYSVFHMQAATGGTTQQATPLVAKEGLQRAVIDLVGDLASYRPDAKLVIFEGENS